MFLWAGVTLHVMFAVVKGARGVVRLECFVFCLSSKLLASTSIPHHCKWCSFISNPFLAGRMIQPSCFLGLVMKKVLGLLLWLFFPHPSQSCRDLSQIFTWWGYWR